MKFLPVLVVAAFAGIAAAPSFAQTRAIPRTADGHPDLQGIWTNATLTPPERPDAFKGKTTLNDAEARAFEKQTVETTASDQRSSDPERDRDHAYNSLFFDRGSELARVDGVKRTALIIDPPDGKIPALSGEARQRNAARARTNNRFDSVLDRPLGERCLMGFGSTSGPPMMPVLYNNNYQIVQTPDTVMILVEMVHDVRIIRMNATHAPQNVRLWLGDSVGHWEGDTLVVETTNFTDKTRFRGSTPNLKVTERFTRSDARSIRYKVTIDDPATFSKPWTMEYPFLATAGPVYEYACHEGNYAMPDILGGARKSDAEGGSGQR
jgi:hypothetical protein